MTEQNNGEIESKEKGGTKLPFLYDFVSVICTAVLMIMLLFTFVFRFVGVNGDSMNPTLYRISTTSKDRFVIYAKQPKLVNVQKTHAGKGFRASGRLAYASISTSKIPNTTNV